MQSIPKVLSIPLRLSDASEPQSLICPRLVPLSASAVTVAKNEYPAIYRQRHIAWPRQLHALSQHRCTFYSLAGALRTRWEMWMAAVSEKYDFVTLAHPRWYGISIADLPIQALFCLVRRCRDPRITRLRDLTHLVHIIRLEARLLNVSRILVRKNPIELFDVVERILDKMHIVPYPNVDAVLAHELSAHGVLFQMAPFVECPEAGIPLWTVEDRARHLPKNGQSYRGLRFIIKA